LSARAALDLGADYLVCQGTEAGGHVQAARGLYKTLPIVLEESRQTPVIASGGIGDGQGIRRALLAGASAAMLGTRFVSTIESNAHPAHQKAIIAAHAKDTALTMCFQDALLGSHDTLRPDRTIHPNMYFSDLAYSAGLHPFRSRTCFIRCTGLNAHLRCNLCLAGSLCDCASLAYSSRHWFRAIDTLVQLDRSHRNDGMTVMGVPMIIASRPHSFSSMTR
jgi:Nitronate monooxygenase